MRTDKIQVRDIDRIQENRCLIVTKGLYIKSGLVIFLTLITGIGIGLWLNKGPQPVVSQRDFDAWPVVYAARGMASIQRVGFYIVPIPKPIRNIKKDYLFVNKRRPLTAIKITEIEQNKDKAKDIQGKKDTRLANKKAVKNPDVKDHLQKTVTTVKDKVQGGQITHTVRKIRKKGFFTLQVRSYMDKNEAAKFFNDLKSKGYGVWKELYKDPKGIVWTRIYVGRFKTKEGAKRFAIRFKRAQNIKGLVLFKEVKNARGKSKGR